MNVRRRGYDNRRLGEHGYTLIEIIISLLVTSILGAAMVSLLVGQGRFYDRSAAAIAAQSSIRAASDFMSTELRMAAPEDLVAATPDSVSLRFDVLRAIVCDSTGTDEATLMVVDTLPDVGLSAAVTGTAYSEPYDSAYAYADGWTGTVTSSGSAPKTTCTDNGEPGAAPDGWYRTITGWGGNFALGVPNRGSFMRQYQLLTYRFAPSVFGTGTAIWRGDQELVGVFDDDATFSYVMADATVQTTVSPVDLPNVRAIRVTGTAVDDGDDRFEYTRDFEFDIELRN